MKDNFLLGIAVVALLLSLVAIASAFVMTPEMTVEDRSIDTSKLADDSVTSSKIDDGAINPDHLSDTALKLISGIGEIADNSITSSKIADGTVANIDISNSADIDPSKILGISWTGSNDGSGSGLDSDTIDGVDSDQFLRNDESGNINGDLDVTGSITHQPETKYYTIPSCAFNGVRHDTPYVISGITLYNTDPAFGSHLYYAPVNLPDGADLNKITIRYTRYNADAHLEIAFMKQSDTDSDIAYESLPQTEFAEFENYEIDITETVSNQNTAYWMYLSLKTHASSLVVGMKWICIEYTVTS
jgi:hypothetical protein